MNSSNFSLSRRNLHFSVISPQAGFFPILLACKISARKFTDNLIGGPLYMMSHFSFTAFKVLAVIFGNLWCVSVWVSVQLSSLKFFGVSWICMSNSLMILGKLGAVASNFAFSAPFMFSILFLKHLQCMYYSTHFCSFGLIISKVVYEFHDCFSCFVKSPAKITGRFFSSNF